MSVNDPASIAQFIKYAYEMSASAIPGGNPPIPSTPSDFPTNYSMAAYVQADDDFWSYRNPEFYGYVAYSETLGQIIIAIRGTTDITEWLIDVEVEMTPFSISGSGNVEDGFYGVFSTMSFIDPSQNAFDLQEFLTSTLAAAPNTRIIIAGHSLGGAIATLLALQVSYQNSTARAASELYTFAAPAAGDAAFAKFFDQSGNGPQTFRYWNVLDVVPAALAVFGFYQVARNGVRIVPTASQLEAYDFLSLDCNHALATYQWLLDPKYPLLASCEWTAATADRRYRLERSVQNVRSRKLISGGGP